MDLTNTYLGLDITTAITNQIGDYWNTQENKRLLASLKGIIAADLATGSPVMTVDDGGHGVLSDCCSRTLYCVRHHEKT